MSVVDSRIAQKYRQFRDVLRSRGVAATLVRKGLGSAAIQASSLLLALALGIWLARILGAAGYSIYAYAMAILNLLMVAGEAGVPTLLMREVAAAGAKNDWPQMRGALKRASQVVITVPVLIATLGIVVVELGFADSDSTQFHTVVVMLVLLPIAVASRVIGEALRGLHHVLVGQAIEMLMRPALALLLVGAIYLLFPACRAPQYAMVAQLVAAAVAVGVGLFALARALPPAVYNASAAYQDRRWLHSALPFVAIGGAVIINNQTDIIMLGWFRPPEEVGIYRVAVQGSLMVAFGLQVANAVIAPQFAKLYAQEDMDALQRLVTISARAVFLTALPVAILFMIAGGVLAAWVFGPEFVASHAPLAVLTAGQLINAFFGSVGFLLNMTGHERSSARVLWQTAALNVVLNIVLIPLYGMTGAAVASSISLIVWNIVLFLTVKRRLGLNSSALGIRSFS